jgi:hypothetical protein
VLSGIRTDKGPLFPMIGIVIGGTASLDGWNLRLSMVENCCDLPDSVRTVTCPAIVLAFLLIYYKRCLYTIRIENTNLFPF